MSTKFNPFEKDNTEGIPAADSDISIQSIHRQQRILLEHLQGGNTINFLQAREMGIGFLNSRIAELRKEITIHSRFVRINNIKCKEYRLAPFEETNVESTRYYKSIMASRSAG